MLAFGTYDPAENCAGSFNYMLMYTPAPLVSCGQDYSSHVNLETLVSYVETIQGNDAW
jgi:hypothetical protein